MYLFSVNKLLKTLVISSLFLVLGNIESVNASIIYTQPQLGNTYVITPTGLDSITHDLSTEVYFTSTTSVNKIRVRTTNNVCPSMTGSGYQSYVKTTAYDYYTFSAVSHTGNYCDMTFNTAMPSGKSINEIRFYSGSSTNMILEGSSSNDQFQYIWSNPVYTAGGVAFALCDSDCTGGLPNASSTDTTTRIIDFTPHDGDVVASSTPVNFTLNYYLSPDDVGTIASVRVKFHNIDQNVLLSFLSDDDITFIDDVNATTSGEFTFSSSTILRAGNYRINASLDRSLAWGLLRNPFSSINTDQSHQFVVATSTFLGHISQNVYRDTQTIYENFTATTTQGLATTCNVLSGFDTMGCLAFLFIPSGEQMNDMLNSFRGGVFSKFPLGYLNRMITIMSSHDTAPLPSLDVHVRLTSTEFQQITFDPNDMLTGGNNIVNSITSPYENKTIRESTEDIVKGLVAVLVVMVIIFDILSLAGSSRKSKHTT